MSSGNAATIVVVAGHLTAKGKLVGAAPTTLVPQGRLAAPAVLSGTTTLAVAARMLVVPVRPLSGRVAVTLSLVGNLISGGIRFREMWAAAYEMRHKLVQAISAKTKLLAEQSDTVLNPGFENGTIGWTFGSGWNVATAASLGTTSINGTFVAAKTSGDATSTIENLGRVPAAAGRRVTATASTLSASATGLIGMQLNWYSAAGTLLGTTELVNMTPGAATSWILTRAVGVAPATTAWACLGVKTTGYSTGAWYIDQCSIYVQPAPDDLPPVGVGSIGSRWSGLTITSTVPSTGTTVTLNVSAALLYMGDNSVAYSSSSATVTQSRSTTVDYYLYYLDEVYAGGAQTLNVSTDPNYIANSNAVIWIGSIEVVSPASGTGGGGFGDHGGGCVGIDMFLSEGCRAGLANVGDVIECSQVDSESHCSQWKPVQANRIQIQPCHRIVTESGAAVVASDSTPMTLRDGSHTYMPKMLGELALVLDDDGMRWELVVSCEPVKGFKPVARISVNENCYFAGEQANKRIATHNTGLKP